LEADIHLLLAGEALGLTTPERICSGFALPLNASSIWRAPGPWQRWQSMPSGSWLRKRGSDP